MHNHFFNGLFALIILVFAIFQWSNVVIIVASAVLLIYSVIDCNNTCRKKMEPMPAKKARTTRKRKKK